MSKFLNSDKTIEFLRYNESSKRILSHSNKNDYKFHEIEQIPIFLQEPYHYFYSLLNSNKHIGNRILDLCAGDGIHSIKFAKMGFDILCTDIAPNSLEIAKIRAEKLGLNNILCQVVDSEDLCFSQHSFDIITIIGSLSYLDLDLFIKQIKRVLKPGGKLLILDSFNHNPIYRVNRFLRYLKGERTISTLKRMPTNKTVITLSKHFSDLSIRYFGIFAFIGRLLSFFFGSVNAAKMVSKWDNKLFFLKKYAFKVVIEITN
jgi:ubiquinone/menaquinone biosynthesis C-methylase UbiE